MEANVNGKDSRTVEAICQCNSLLAL